MADPPGSDPPGSDPPGSDPPGSDPPGSDPPGSDSRCLPASGRLSDSLPPAGLDLAGIRDRLTDRHHQIVTLTDSTAAARKPVELDQSRVGRLSRINALQDQAMSLATARRRAAELKRIEAALARLADGAFGYCASCGEPIAVKRLELDPTTPICILCAKKAL